MKDKIMNLLNINDNNLSEIAKELISNSNTLDKYFNLTLLLGNRFNYYKINKNCAKK